MFISNDIKYVGVNDRRIDLFEGQYIVPNGMSYNSYVFLDEKIAVMDSVEKGFSDEWLNNIKAATDGKSPDYLIIQHMEPDHSSSINIFLKEYPDTVVVASSKAFTMMQNFFGVDFTCEKLTVGENDILSLGKHTLTFLTAPMVHWPEVIVTYDFEDKVLFSADAFGKFGAIDDEDDWACEARRYYFGIVGKFGGQAKKLLEKASSLEIEKICPLHGPVLSENLDYYINLYNIWTSYGVETDGVMIAYTSVYGNTKRAVEILESELKAKGCPKVVVSDLARSDMAENVEDAFRYGKIVLATTTYNGDIFPFMRDFITHLTEHNYMNRKIGFIEDGSWMPMATKVMQGLLEKSKNITFCESNVKITSGVNEINIAEIKALAEELCK